MEEIDLRRIINTIKDGGITAYEISKNTPLSEAGINKILSGLSTNPRKTTLLVLQDYLFGSREEKHNNKQMVDQLKEINAQRKIQGLTWEDLAKGLPITGNALRMALVDRKNVQPEYLSIIRQNLNTLNIQEKTLETLMGNVQIEESKIPDYIVENEDRLMTNNTFRLWLTTKIQEGVIKTLKNN
jgi:hypothetical protein